MKPNIILLIILIILATLLAYLTLRSYNENRVIDGGFAFWIAEREIK